VDLSGDLAVARRQLELQRPKESMEEIQSKAVENWLAFRASQKDGNLSSEERQQQAVERWLEYRRTQGLGADSERDVDQEADKPREKDLDRGIDDDWGLE
jgi:phosphoglucomutase